MVANSAAATLSGVALVTEVRVATLDANSLLFIRYPLAVRSYIRAGCGYGSGCRFAGLRATGSTACAVAAPPRRGPGGAGTLGRRDATRRPPARKWRPAEACASVARRLHGRGSVRPGQRGVAHDRLEAAERRQVLGGAPGDEPRAVAVAPELERQGPQEAPGEAFEEGEREPGEVGAGGHEQRPAAAGVDDGAHAGVGAAVELLEEGRERGARVARRQRQRCVVVDPGAACEVVVGGGRAQAGDGRARRRCPRSCRQSARGAATPGRSSPSSTPPQCRSLCPSARRRSPSARVAVSRISRMPGALGVEPGHGLGKHGVDPHRNGGHAEGTAASRVGGVEGLVGRLELVEDAPPSAVRRSRRGCRCRRRRRPRRSTWISPGACWRCRARWGCIRTPSGTPRGRTRPRSRWRDTP